MYRLVKAKNNVPFTTSKVIADGTGVQHHAVQTLIQKYEKNLAQFGQVSFEMRAVKYSRGTNEEKIYFLNEQQATFLMTLMRNDGTEGIIVKFKARLVEEFFHMREFIREKNTEHWEQTRIQNKETRLKETEVIKLLAKYAREQGSTHSDMLYISYTKLAKTVAKEKRDEMNASDLNNITLTENIILQTIRLGMLMDKHYKDIYRECKERVEQFKDIAYLKEQKAL